MAQWDAQQKMKQQEEERRRDSIEALKQQKLMQLSAETQALQTFAQVLTHVLRQDATRLTVADVTQVRLTPSMGPRRSHITRFTQQISAQTVSLV